MKLTGVTFWRQAGNTPKGKLHLWKKHSLQSLCCKGLVFFCLKPSAIKKSSEKDAVMNLLNLIISWCPSATLKH